MMKTMSIRMSSTRLWKQQQDEQDGAAVETVYFTDLVLGSRLGRGCFADVHEVLHFQPLAARAPPGGSGRRHQDSKAEDSKYAIKSLRTDFKNPKTFPRAARDLQTEVDLLSEIAHPHIINIYAKSASDTNASICSPDNAHDFFIVMDRLSGNLTQKLGDWSQEQVQVKASCSGFFCRPSKTPSRNKPQRDPFLERLKVGHDVALALTYLHEQSIIYRDLKSDNVGFDMDGTVKLFDFGLARRLPRDDDDDDEAHNNVGEETCFRMTKLVGSLPHMAPEVWKGEPYNEKADVYSFAILLWVIMTLDMPYIEMAFDLQLLTKRVMLDGHRPTIPSDWPPALQNLLSKAWHADLKERPSMQAVCHGVGAMLPRPRSLRRASSRAMIKRTSSVAGMKRTSSSAVKNTTP